MVNAMATDTMMLEFSNTTDLIPQTYMALAWEGLDVC